MTQFKALFLDIDGTTVRRDHTIEPSTKMAVQQVQKKGVEVFLATGRPLHEVDEIALELNIHSMIGYNGAFALSKGQTVVNTPIKAPIIQQFLKVASTHHHELVLYSRDTNYFTSMDSGIVKTFMKTFLLRKNDIVHEGIYDSILGVSLIGVEEEAVHFYELDEDLRFSPINVSGIGSCYDVIRTSVNKGEAVKQILELRNIPASLAIAFGDGLNDREMLQNVGESFAMGNANPALFSFAKHRTTSVEASGIYNGLKYLGLMGERKAETP